MQFNKRERLDVECPSNDFEQGNPNGKCWGDGHFQCKECKHFREDFNRLGQDYIDFAHSPLAQPIIFENV